MPTRKNTEWEKDFIVQPENRNPHFVAYCMFLLLDDDLWAFDWSHSGNPDIDGDGERDGPYRPGNSDAAVLGDTNGATALPWNKPTSSTHNGHGPARRFQDSNVLYGDGHAETHGTLQHYVYRIPVPAWLSW